MLTRSLLPFLFPLCVMCTFWLQLSLRFSSLSLAFSNLVLTCLGVVFFMFILRVCCSSLGHALDFHQIWEILGHSVCPCCSRPHTLGPQGLLEWLTDAALVVVCSCLNFLFLCFVLDNFCCCVFKFIEVFFCIVSSDGNCVQYVCYLVYFILISGILIGVSCLLFPSLSWPRFSLFLNVWNILMAQIQHVLCSFHCLSFWVCTYCVDFFPPVVGHIFLLCVPGNFYYISGNKSYAVAHWILLYSWECWI